MQSLLLRFYDPVRGKVTFDGQGTFMNCPPGGVWLDLASPDIREFNPGSWRNIIGIVPQAGSNC